MLFNSFEFILIFLPLSLAGFFLLALTSHKVAAGWLALVSLIFYAWWDARFVALLGISILFNFFCGARLSSARGTAAAKPILIFAVAVNLLNLGFWKYTNFLIVTYDSLTGSRARAADIILPLGISFFTFTQIAFLVDAYRGLAREYNIMHYVLFVSYFPHLIAGPVIHHSQVMPQFSAPSTYRADSRNFCAGMLMFAMGMAKKVVLADSFAEYSSPVFEAARGGMHPNAIAAWTGALAYTGQIYFDFSGYSDMAIGLSKMIGVELPLNFNSPYKAGNIIEFWRRWHISLSAFLRDYLYIPLGGNRHGPVRRHVNLLTTMVLGGLWHGANWTFVVWGGLHGMFLVINHGWQGLVLRLGLSQRLDRAPVRALARLLTLLCVIIAWVFFRADNFATASRMLQGMALLGPTLPAPLAHLPFELAYKGILVPPDSFTYVLMLFLLGALLVNAAPNSQTILARFPYRAASERYLAMGAFGFIILLLAAIGASRGISEFIYFNF